MDAVEEEVEHEEEGTVREELVDVEDEAVHAVLEELHSFKTHSPSVQFPLSQFPTEEKKRENAPSR